MNQHIYRKIEYEFLNKLHNTIRGSQNIHIEHNNKT